MNKEIMHDARVIVFDSILYKDDISTPSKHTMRPATVVCRYGRKDAAITSDWPERIYDDLVDVIFDHRPERVSKGHFTYAVSLIGD